MQSSMLASQVGMEFVSTVSEASDLVSKVAIFLNLGLRILQHSRPILAHTQAYVVFQVCSEFQLCDGLVFKVIRLLLKNAVHHRVCV